MNAMLNKPGPGSKEEASMETKKIPGRRTRDRGINSSRTWIRYLRLFLER